MRTILPLSANVLWVLVSVALCGCNPGEMLWNQVIKEQRQLEVRDSSQLPRAPIPPVPPPPTVSNPPPPTVPSQFSLDQAIRIALENSRVVRVLAGVTAVSSGQTIYDPAITNTDIDLARSTFDPFLTFGNTFNRNEQPQAFLDPRDPNGARIGGIRVDSYQRNLVLSKNTITGGSFNLDVSNNVSRFQPGLFPLNPEERSSVTLSYNQPLLQGAGLGPNLAPIVIARINTERSFFRYKDSVQELVRGVIEAYWAVVFARIDVWARQQQAEQSKSINELAEARQRAGLGTAGEAAQSRVSFANFRANLISAEANLLQREAVFRNLLGLSPSLPDRIIPLTPPTSLLFEPKWDEILNVAEQRRPDIVELKLILEADEQVLLQANNLAQPRVDAVMFYRWNGLEGETPTGVRIATGPGQFTDWTLGVNFSVPLGLRQARAGLRRAELLIARDRANLEQGLHSAAHDLGGNVRNLAQFYKQYQVFKETREAARINLDQQLALFRSNIRARQTIFLNVLQAISDWGNAVSAEAQSLTLYNTELANLERQTGTILDTHGIRFVEESYQSIGPLGRCAEKRPYPSSIYPGPNEPRYPANPEPIEQSLDPETLPYPRQMPRVRE